LTLSSAWGTPQVERLANAFASLLLLPESTVWRSPGERVTGQVISWRGLVEMAR
jgi:Zn-dependent peptidase ImmA (M78 family)